MPVEDMCAFTADCMLAFSAASLEVTLNMQPKQQWNAVESKQIEYGPEYGPVKG